MTFYLWHVPAASAGMAVWLALTVGNPGLDSWWLSAVVQLAVGLPVLALVAPFIGRLDLRLVPPGPGGGHLVGALGATTALLAGTWLIWRNGLVVHPALPRSSLGVALVLVAITGNGPWPGWRWPVRWCWPRSDLDQLRVRHTPVPGVVVAANPHDTPRFPRCDLTWNSPRTAAGGPTCRTSRPPAVTCRNRAGP